MEIPFLKKIIGTPDTNRFDALTGIRWLAASMVFVYHNRKYFRSDIPSELLRIVNEFNAGVSLFFVLSGFLIAYSYNDRPLDSGKNYLRYILVRIARIFPLYWLILTAYYLDPAYGKCGHHWLTYSLLHGFSDKFNLLGIAQAWSLTVEMSFYFLAPFLCLLHRKHVFYLVGTLIGLAGLSWATGLIWHSVNGNPSGFFGSLPFILQSTFPGRSSEFLAGILLARLVEQYREQLSRIRYKTALGFVGFLLILYLIGLFQADIYHHGTEHPVGLALHALILPVFVVFMLSGLIDERTWLQRFFASPLMVLLGNASFAFYLIHISYVNLKIREWIQLPDRNYLLLWLVSIGLYLIVEKPIYDKCRKWIKKI